MVRIIGLAALVAGIWLLSAANLWRPHALSADAPAPQFSAARAQAVLGRVLADQRPHPAGSAEAESVRGRILQELARMGIYARTQIGMSCRSEPRWGNIACATVTNIIAGVSPGAGEPADKDVVLMAHSDSVAAGPGAGDDGSGVAILLETIRALKARGNEQARGSGGRHAIVAVFTDGEENGLLGANLFLKDPLRRARTGAVINVEARGNQGPSYLFQTSKGNGPLIDLYARSVKRYATSSLYGEIYKYLPNDTDLTPVLAAGIPGYNFAFIGNAAQYHTPLDRRENLDPRSIQQQGDSVLALADALSRADHRALKGEDAVYLDIWELWLPRLAAGWALPLSIAAFLLIVVAGLQTQRPRRDLPQPLLAAAMPALLLAGAVGIGFLLHGLAAWIAGVSDPSFAHPVWLRLSLAFGVFAVALLAAQRAGAIACWLWLSGLAVISAILAPGLSPYFLFPSLVAAPLLLATARGGRDIALFIAALAALVIWIGLNAGAEPIMGLKLHPLFTVTAAFGLLALLPLLRPAAPWGRASAGSLLLALLLAVVAGFQPAFSDQAPQRLNLRYVEQDGRAWWQADPVAQLPPSLRAAARFSASPQRLVDVGYVAPAGSSQFPAPSALVQRSGDTVTLTLHAAGDGVALLVPKEAALKSLSLGDATAKADGEETVIGCATPDCGSARLVLELGSPSPVRLTLIARRRGLPPLGAKLVKARPSWSVPSQSGDATLLVTSVPVPAR
jgi:hypothetical protein